MVGTGYDAYTIKCDWASGASTGTSIIYERDNANAYTSATTTCNWATSSSVSIWKQTPYKKYGTETYGTYGSATAEPWTANFGTSCSAGPWIINHVTKSPQEKLREMIRDRQAPLVIQRRTSIESAQDIREKRARETLLRVLGHDKFRRFLKHGFVSVMAKSGLVYQIFPGSGITNVFKDGSKVERLCVVLKGNFPPTDSLIMRYLLILNDEQDFRGYAIKHAIVKASEITNVIKTSESLNEAWNRLKVA